MVVNDFKKQHLQTHLLELCHWIEQFQVIGVEYAGPLYYWISPIKEGKAYILLFSCSLTRVIHLQLLKEQTTKEFIRSLELLIVRRGHPRTIYSDNARTFIAAASSIKKVVKNGTVHNFLAHQDIKWKFNLSRAPWWCGQFERLIGLTKNTMERI